MYKKSNFIILNRVICKISYSGIFYIRKSGCYGWLFVILSEFISDFINL